jgi:alpha-1,6-mannosyltransferase
MTHPLATARRGQDTARHLRLVPEQRASPLRVADVALFYGERSGGIRTYLDAKAAHARESGRFEHHLVVPGRQERHSVEGAAWRHELPSLRVAAANGYRMPLGAGALKATLRLVEADVVAAARFAAANRWPAALDAELADLGTLVA